MLMPDLSKPITQYENRFLRKWIKETRAKLVRIDSPRASAFDVEEDQRDQDRLRDENAIIEIWQIQVRLRVLEGFLGIT